jgi:methionyl aminopeptidase
MSIIKSKEEQKKMVAAGERLASVFSGICFRNLIGKTTEEIDLYLARSLDNQGMVSCCKGYHGFSGHACISVNDQLIHGVPKKTTLIKETDLIKIDICASYNGFCADAARPYGVFSNNSLYNDMYICGFEALNKGVASALFGNYVMDISAVIEDSVTTCGYSVVREFAGHGIGRKMHEDPEVPNYRFCTREKSQKLYPGMTLAVEPMFCQKKSEVSIDVEDHWTVRTKDKGIAMHCEDTILITESEPIILTRLK